MSGDWVGRDSLSGARGSSLPDDNASSQGILGNIWGRIVQWLSRSSKGGSANQSALPKETPEGGDPAFWGNEMVQQHQEEWAKQLVEAIKGYGQGVFDEQLETLGGKTTLEAKFSEVINTDKKLDAREIKQIEAEIEGATQELSGRIGTKNLKTLVLFENQAFPDADKKQLTNFLKEDPDFSTKVLSEDEVKTKLAGKLLEGNIKTLESLKDGVAFIRQIKEDPDFSKKLLSKEAVQGKVDQLKEKISAKNETVVNQFLEIGEGAKFKSGLEKQLLDVLKKSPSFSTKALTQDDLQKNLAQRIEDENAYSLDSFLSKPENKERASLKEWVQSQPIFKEKVLSEEMLKSLFWRNENEQTVNTILEKLPRSEYHKAFFKADNIPSFKASDEQLKEFCFEVINEARARQLLRKDKTGSDENAVIETLKASSNWGKELFSESDLSSQIQIAQSIENNVSRNAQNPKSMKAAILEYVQSRMSKIENSGTLDAGAINKMVQDGKARYLSMEEIKTVVNQRLPEGDASSKKKAVDFCIQHAERDGSITKSLSSRDIDPLLEQFEAQENNILLIESAVHKALFGKEQSLTPEESKQKNSAVQFCIQNAREEGKITKEFLTGPSIKAFIDKWQSTQLIDVVVGSKLGGSYDDELKDEAVQFCINHLQTEGKLNQDLTTSKITTALNQWPNKLPRHKV